MDLKFSRRSSEIRTVMQTIRNASDDDDEDDDFFSHYFFCYSFFFLNLFSKSFAFFFVGLSWFSDLAFGIEYGIILSLVAVVIFLNLLVFIGFVA